MKISINSIRSINKRFASAGDPAPNGIDELSSKIGAQLGGVEDIIPVGKKYGGVVIVKVVTCVDHPNADRLHVCTIDDGGIATEVQRDADGLVQVVCGAPNVAAGLNVAWLPPGSTVPSSFDTDPFVLEARELRGVMSNGMLASPKELALGDSHEGILIIDEVVEPGTMFADKYGLQGDVVLDIENKMFTHRPDCFGWLGVAREIAGIQGQVFKSPDWYRSDDTVPAAEGDQLPLIVRNEVPELVPRFTAVTMSGITIAPSPVWLQVELARVGVRPINNIVDVTNYFMLLTGQPLHAYDYDKVRAQDTGVDDGDDHATLVVRKPNEGEKLLLLNGKEIVPRTEAILIATESTAIGLGGVMGGGDTEVDANTKNIILECANFNMYSIRRTAMAHGVFTDAVTRFNKGQSPLQNMAVLAKIVEDIMRLVGGKVASEVIDDNHLADDVRERNALFPDVIVTTDFINTRLGEHLTVEQMTTLLTNVEFAVQADGETLTVRAPFWRTDIEIREDIVEEVGRLYGYDKLPLELPKRTIAPAVKDISLESKSAIRDALSRAGANEVLTYSFVHGNLLDKVGQDAKLAFKLGNALSPDLQYFRLSLTPSLLDKVHANIKAGYDEFALFELGKTHVKSELDEDGLPKEFGRLVLVYAAGKTVGGAAYYQAVKFLHAVLPGTADEYTFMTLADLKGEPYDSHQPFQQLCKPFDPLRTAAVFNGKKLVGVVGEYAQKVQKALKLPKQSAGFEVFLSAFENVDAITSAYTAIPRFPKVSQDMTLKVAADLPYRKLYDVVRESFFAAEKDRTADELLVTVSPLDIYQSKDDTAHKNVTFRITVASYEKTLTDTEVSTLLEAAAKNAGEQFGAIRL